MDTATLPPPSAPSPSTRPIELAGQAGAPWAAPEATQRRRAPRTRRTAVMVGLGTIAAIASTFVGNEAVLAIGFLFVISWPLERMFRRHPVPVRRLALRTDLAYAVSQPALQVAALAAGVVIGVLSLAWLPGLLVRPLVTSLPGWLQITSGVLLFDLIVYWAHRWGHTVPLFWRFHSVHHSTKHLDWVSGFRAHPLDGIMIAPAIFFLVAAGFDNTLTGALAILQFLVGLGAHLNVRFKLRPLWPIVMTPEFHHWHHELSPAAHHSNYSTFLPLWDIVFRTYRMPRHERPQHYGISQHMPDGIARQLLHPFKGLRRDWRRWRTARQARRAFRQMQQGRRAQPAHGA
jgi:sterol desaturase/sphingolipid hydroxylase (fatty acid hydroxylase superfamily)